MSSRRRKSVDAELEDMIRKNAEYAQSLQKTITEGEAMERWVDEGNLAFLDEKVFSLIERETFQTLKSPEFDPANISHSLS